MVGPFIFQSVRFLNALKPAGSYDSRRNVQHERLLRLNFKLRVNSAPVCHLPNTPDGFAEVSLLWQCRPEWVDSADSLRRIEWRFTELPQKGSGPEGTKTYAPLVETVYPYASRSSG